MGGVLVSFSPSAPKRPCLPHNADKRDAPFPCRCSTQIAAGYFVGATDNADTVSYAASFGLARLGHPDQHTDAAHVFPSEFAPGAQGGCGRAYSCSDLDVSNLLAHHFNGIQGMRSSESMGSFYRHISTT